MVSEHNVDKINCHNLIAKGTFHWKVRLKCLQSFKLKFGDQISSRKLCDQNPVVQLIAVSLTVSWRKKCLFDQSLAF